MAKTIGSTEWPKLPTQKHKVIGFLSKSGWKACNGFLGKLQCELTWPADDSTFNTSQSVTIPLMRINFAKTADFVRRGKCVRHSHEYGEGTWHWHHGDHGIAQIMQVEESKAYFECTKSADFLLDGSFKLREPCGYSFILIHPVYGPFFVAVRGYCALYGDHGAPYQNRIPMGGNDTQEKALTHTPSLCLVLSPRPFDFQTTRAWQDRDIATGINPSAFFAKAAKTGYSFPSVGHSVMAQVTKSKLELGNATSNVEKSLIGPITPTNIGKQSHEIIKKRKRPTAIPSAVPTVESTNESATVGIISASTGRVHAVRETKGQSIDGKTKQIGCSSGSSMSGQNCKTLPTQRLDPIVTDKPDEHAPLKRAKVEYVETAEGFSISKVPSIGEQRLLEIEIRTAKFHDDMLSGAFNNSTAKQILVSEVESLNESLAMRDRSVQIQEYIIKSQKNLLEETEAALQKCNGLLVKERVRTEKFLGSMVHMAAAHRKESN